MKIKIASVMVDDQEKALQFYTTKLGFIKKNDIPMGEHRWLTLTSPESSAEVELLLEPNSNPAVPAKEFQQSLKQAGIPATVFFVDDIEQEFEKIRDLGVTFTVPPMQAGPVKIAILDDTCGNLIQICQVPVQ